jgi:adenine-specific DNA-methyltransferase
VIFSYAQKASQDFAELFDGLQVFENPKSYRDLERLISYLTDPGDLVLDFFAGSGTMGHAALLANQEFSLPRRFILVQLPESLDPDNKKDKVAAEFCLSIDRPLNLCEITKERLRRAIKKIKAEQSIVSGDLGFRVFKLASSNIRAWEPDYGNLAEALEGALEHLQNDSTEQDILYELLLKLGLDLSIPIEHEKLTGKTVYNVGGGVLIACLAEKIDRAEVEMLALGIVDWRKEQAPAGDTTCVFRDSAFIDDVAKTNLAAILEQNGIRNVRSL